ncbi:MAG TPA: hypothetical protein VGC79_27460, partial [Polyangiaceae bacterium]
VVRIAWAVYFFYLRGQIHYSEKFDPISRRLFSEHQEFNERDAAIYRKYAGPVMRLWRAFFGFGSLVFGLAVSIGFGLPEYYLVFRLVLLNAVFYGYLRPTQRKASRRALDEIMSPA